MKKTGNAEEDRKGVARYNRMQASKSIIAGNLRREGFKTKVHALPPEIKSEVDRLLIRGMTAKAVLENVCKTFPELERDRLPSIVSLRAYKNRYVVLPEYMKDGDKSLGMSLKDLKDNSDIVNKAVEELKSNYFPLVGMLRSWKRLEKRAKFLYKEFKEEGSMPPEYMAIERQLLEVQSKIAGLIDDNPPLQAVLNQFINVTNNANQGQLVSTEKEVDFAVLLQGLGSRITERGYKFVVEGELADS